MKSINNFRHQIDEIDQAIAELLLRRDNLVVQTWRAKIESAIPLFDPAREAQIIENLRNNLNLHDAKPEQIERVERIYKFILNLNQERKNEV